MPSKPKVIIVTSGIPDDTVKDIAFPRFFAEKVAALDRLIREHEEKVQVIPISIPAPHSQRVAASG